MSHSIYSAEFDPDTGNLHELDQVESLFLDIIPRSTATSDQVVRHVFAGGGKRVRPRLFLLVSDLVGYHGEHRHRMAAVCEMIHAASLLHDDVIDDSPLRRGRASSHTLWGDETAILVGDLIYARASELMAQTGELDIVSLFARVIREMSEAEILQLEQLFDPGMNQERYFRVLHGKTASLIAATCEAPAILAGSGRAAREALRSFGLNVGFAFQLIDDALDFTASSEGLGKKAAADLKDGKLTHPVLSLGPLMSPEEGEKFSGIVAASGFQAADLAFIMELVKKYDTPAQTLELARGITEKALAQLDAFPDCTAKSTLTALTQTLLARAY